MRAPRVRLLSRLLPLAIVAVAGCDAIPDPSASAVVAFSPSFSADVRASANFFRAAGVVFDRVRLVVTRLPSDVLKDTTVAYAPGQSDLQLQLSVAAVPNEQLEAKLEYKSGDLVVYRGSTTVVAQAPSSDAPAAVVPVQIADQGVLASNVTVSPSSGNFPADTNRQLSAVVRGENGAILSGATLVWSVNDETVAGVTQAGVVQPKNKDGTVVVTAATVTGVSGQAQLKFVTTRPTSVVMVSGNGQSGTVGTSLANPLVVRVTDGLDRPVVGATVAWARASGGGSVSPSTNATGSDGRASATYTLGLTPGNESVTATVTGLPPVTFTMSGSVRFLRLSAPAGTVITGTAGVAINNPPYVLVTDSTNQPVAGVTLTASLLVNGQVFISQPIVSGANGIATVAAVIPPQAGTFTIHVTHPTAAGSPIVFSVQISSSNAGKGPVDR
jgi:hypothetical protein